MKYLFGVCCWENHQICRVLPSSVLFHIEQDDISLGRTSCT